MLAISMINNEGNWSTEYYPDTISPRIADGCLILVDENDIPIAGLSPDMWSTFAYVGEEGAGAKRAV